jgi:hypothetical protein
MSGWQIAVAAAAAWIGASAFVAFGAMGIVVADFFGDGQEGAPRRREFGVSNFLIAAGASFLIAAAVFQVFD